MKPSQEARDAAADYLLLEDGVRESDVRKIRSGLRDDDPLLQAIAAAEARGMERAAILAEQDALAGMEGMTFAGALMVKARTERIAAAIRALID